MSDQKEILELIKLAPTEELIKIKKKIEEELAKRTGNKWLQKLAKKIPYFTEKPEKIKYIAENGKWVYFDVNVSRSELQSVKQIVNSAKVHCFTRVNTDIYVQGRRIFVSRLLGVLKADLEGDDKNE